MKVLMLTKEHFWDKVLDESPIVMNKFLFYIDDFKKAINWDQLFNSGADTGMLKRGENGYGHKKVLTIAPKFHDLPFCMQKGVIENFLISEKIQFYSAYHPDDESKWMNHIVDQVHNAIWTSMEGVTPRMFNTSEDADIDAIRMAFDLLNKNYLTNFN
jgi:hypothetical protein